MDTILNRTVEQIKKKKAEQTVHRVLLTKKAVLEFVYHLKATEYFNG